MPCGFGISLVIYSHEFSSLNVVGVDGVDGVGKKQNRLIWHARREIARKAARGCIVKILKILPGDPTPSGLPFFGLMGVFAEISGT